MNLLIGLIFILAGAAAIFVGVKYGKRQPVKSAVPIYFPFLFGGLYPEIIRFVIILLGIVLLVAGISFIFK
ncbi:hypothetical protein [Liquorilactobacillus sicerae]|uniref:hypothetical protein n=1 Tax=Liquorilactobacillus sicerae TaxID=1416943 RepID=UPI00248194FD|nr:hypothetical protein [Liquorilactobacillus sicerae]